MILLIFLYMPKVPVNKSHYFQYEIFCNNNSLDFDGLRLDFSHTSSMALGNGNIDQFVHHFGPD